MIFLNSASSAAALVFYLPGVFTRTDTEGKKQKGIGPEYFKIFPKNTIFNEHPVSKILFSLHMLIFLFEMNTNLLIGLAWVDASQRFSWE